MDPVSHVAFGRTLIALDGQRTLGPGAIAACVFGSLTPDLDAVFMPIGWDVYLRHHQGGTHSLIGSLACAALTAALVRLFAKRADYPASEASRPVPRERSKAWPYRGAKRRGLYRVSEVSRGPYLPLLLAAWAGATGHLLLDVISGADIRFFWPLGPAVALPLFAMADPWLGGVLVVGLVMLALRRASSRRAAAAILIAMTVFAGAKAALYARARERDRTSEGSAQFRRAETEWGSLTRWVIYGTRAEVVDARRVNALTGTVTPLFDVPRGLSDPLVVRSRELDTVQNFLAVHGVTFAVVVGAGARQRQVLWSDLRYCSPVDRRAARWPPWAPTDLGSGLPVSCTLWFGGEFDSATGRPTAAIVHVGNLVQARPIP